MLSWQDLVIGPMELFFGNNTIAAEVLSNVLLPNKLGQISVSTEDFFLPWELMYPSSLNDPLSFENFWGYRRIISRVVVQDTRPGAFVSPIILVNSLPDVGLLTDDLPAVHTLEAP